MQTKHKFRFPLPKLLATRNDKVDTSKAELLTDDFAPVNLYDTIGRERPKRK